MDGRYSRERSQEFEGMSVLDSCGVLLADGSRLNVTGLGRSAHLAILSLRWVERPIKKVNRRMQIRRRPFAKHEQFKN